jgi:hypothetical protein
MSDALTKNLKCLLIRGGIEIWLEADELAQITLVLEKLAGKQTFLALKGRIINTFEIQGIFTPEDMANKERIRKGLHRCEHGKWWKRGEDCDCEERIGAWGPTREEAKLRG